MKNVDLSLSFSTEFTFKTTYFNAISRNLFGSLVDNLVKQWEANFGYFNDKNQIIFLF